MYEDRPINKLHNGIILLVFKIQDIMFCTKFIPKNVTVRKQERRLI